MHFCEQSRILLLAQQSALNVELVGDVIGFLELVLEERVLRMGKQIESCSVRILTLIISEKSGKFSVS